MDDDEDKLLLSSLGVASANPEDIERKVIAEAKNDSGYASEPKESSEEQKADHEHETNPSSVRRVKLHNKLRAVEVEIDAVASSIKKAKYVAESEESFSSEKDIRDDEDITHGCHAVEIAPDGITLQQALAADRLRSLNKTRVQLQKEISSFAKDLPLDDVGCGKVLDQLVKGKLKPKKKLKEGEPSHRGSKHSLKTVDYDEDADFDAILDAASGGFIETERDELVRKGILTPFHKLKGFERRVQQPGPSRRQSVPDSDDLTSASIAKVVQSMSDFAQARPTTKLIDAKTLPGVDVPTRPFQRLRTPLKHPGSPRTEQLEKQNKKRRKHRRPLPDKRWRKDNLSERFSDENDGDARGNSATSDCEENQDVNDDEEEEKDELPSVLLEGGLKIPSSIYTQLFDYQKVGVQWLWELHCQKTGGIIGDEMGLGKTIQVISFLAALHYSKMYMPSIVICPVTLLRQWQREAKKWYPKFKVEILHDSAHGYGKHGLTKASESDSDSEASYDSEDGKPLPAKSKKRWDDLIKHIVNSEAGLLLTTYEQLRLWGEKLLDIEWGYAILDEGHRIRNPNAEVTLVCKQLQTVHRIIMTGAPIQNKLAELWSLFDFVFPGKLGVLPVFETEFAVPISVGGYANASPLQVSTAYRCAVVLRDLIMPYLLRRMKADVNAQLPKKTEHVLFCSLTSDQRSAYRAFLASAEVEQIFDGNRNSLYGIDVMRKICNHPDLLEREHAAQNPDYGNPERSGKMKVVVQVLKVWREQGHRALLFTQTQQMLDIMENFLISSEYSYRRMDGHTPVKQRMALIDEFNNSSDVFIFILTTKVGGLGTNLTGADRVIIYDPDWNPSTDMQARERAWRIGQKKDVTVYRLITRGTIEEKVYHRQIYKHFLTNKILKNPQQKRFFKARDMRDLFTLQNDSEGNSTETSNIFKQLSGEVNLEVGQDKPAPSSVSIAASISSANGPHSSEVRTSMSSKKGKETVNGSEVEEETDILRSLFDANGIHSAMNHDAIMNANDNDKMRLEEEAAKVAQRAAEALRESRMIRSRESFALPTWTGRSGAAGAPASVRKKFGSTVNSQLVRPLRPSTSSGFSAGFSTNKALSSAELLAKIKGRQERAISDALQQDLDLSSSSNHRAEISENNRGSRLTNRFMIVQPEVLIRQLCTFIQQRGGVTDSASITQHFKDRVQSKDLALFKNLLKEIATLEKDSNGSRWVLKPDYN
ncbi:DNA excision repair protein CSB [Dioscorea cayenensis subsp. rotundata]|uniref:DNA excision repair protein CSB n=1 Tax=Dioscorea cayennensis subsp. rotundata TaxID=55577 RepID=A0AB40C0X5_DIOCR|nr:DNA excision repair protein CSB [Dioscorea cayenensis subsp. rotundata]